MVEIVKHTEENGWSVGNDFRYSQLSMIVEHFGGRESMYLILFSKLDERKGVMRTRISTTNRTLIPTSPMAKKRQARTRS